MSGSVNRVILIGRAGKDAQTRNFPDGGKIVSFSMATGKRWRDRNTGERREEATWHNIVVKDSRLAEIAERYVRKGGHLYVEGEIQNRSWDKDGVKHYISEVVIPPFGGRLDMLDRRQAETGEPRGEDRPAQQPDRTDPKGNPRYDEPRGGSSGNLIDDEIPFAPSWE